MRRVLLPLVLLIAFAAGAQDPGSSYVEADGEATIFAIPTHAEFLAVFTPGAAKPAATRDPASPSADPAAPAPATEPTRTDDAPMTNAAAVAAVDDAVKAFRKALNDFDIHPVDFEVSTPTPRDVATANASSTARMRFSLGGFTNPDTGPGQFADLCDKLANLARTNNALIIGPTFEVEDKESVIRNAVTQAIANAYPIADALALALSSRIASVDVAKVVDIIWNKPLRDTPIEPNLKQIACTAKVHVTYAVPAPTP